MIRPFALLASALGAVLLVGPSVAPAARAQTPPSEFVTVDRQPERLSGIDPVYPDGLRAAGVDGRVVVRAWVSKDGTVKAVEVLRSDDPRFDANTLAAVRTWRFRPAMRDGQPVEVWLTIPIRFRLEEDASDEQFEAQLTAAFDRTTRTAEQCAALAPVVFDFTGEALVLQGVTDPRKVFDYGLCARDGHTSVVERMVYGPDGPPSEEEASALGGRLGEQAMIAAFARTDADCAALPQAMLVLRDGAFTLDGRPPDASQFDYFACTSHGHMEWLKGLDAGGKEPGEAVVGRWLDELFLRIFAAYLGLDLGD